MIYDIWRNKNTILARIPTKSYRIDYQNLTKEKFSKIFQMDSIFFWNITDSVFHVTEVIR